MLSSVASLLWQCSPPKGDTLSYWHIKTMQLASPKATYAPTEMADGEDIDIKVEQEEANFILEAVHAQCNVFILEQQLAAVKVEEMVALGNLYWFRAQEAKHTFAMTYTRAVLHYTTHASSAKLPLQKAQLYVCVSNPLFVILA
ncbi:hypothetical protein PISMIDRAFT_11285 [Pisolithus microcarpus 441]|uniref:Uncharacterized protein n=1 Tax=Pisolithus microcarpus 441 TaxID=765257 RepID=A0A0C9ZAC2_9AGAM|nr:hypothetical protein BKA83DRAFT_11285 [Pisolithus microcarpus]KIK22914.1 hypothetical protein PISMIDRAFT_11285 [Pisolithus microcarpus 441]